jgi:ABC-type lipoprotein release transport system permease subunit
MATRTPPFAPFEWMIAWRYLRARRAEGGRYIHNFFINNRNVFRL